MEFEQVDKIISRTGAWIFYLGIGFLAKFPPVRNSFPVSENRQMLLNASEFCRLREVSKDTRFHQQSRIDLITHQNSRDSIVRLESCIKMLDMTTSDLPCTNNSAPEAPS